MMEGIKLGVHVLRTWATCREKIIEREPLGETDLTITQLAIRKSHVLHLMSIKLRWAHLRNQHVIFVPPLQSEPYGILM